MSELDLPDLDLRYRKRRQQADGGSFRNQILARVGSIAGSQAKGRKWGGAKPVFVKPLKEYSRRAVIKARIVKMNESGQKAARLHIRYIEREGVEKDGSKGEMYGRDEKFNRDSLVQQIEGESRQFRFIISPEDGEELDLTAYARAIVEQMEKDIGRQLIWGAVNHYNTDNPHTHLVIRGICQEGRDLQIDPEYIKHGMRNRAQEIATKELGVRTELDIQQQRQREITQERFTSLDREIEKYVRDDRFRFPMPDEPKMWIDRNVIVARLQVLESMGLATWMDDMSWDIASDWKQSLRAMGERGDIIKSMHKAVGEKAVSYDIYRRGQAIPSIEGRVIRKGLSDELYDKYYLLVEQANGRSSYIELEKYVDPDSIQEGSIVHIKTRESNWVRETTDNNIDETATKNNGLYLREVHSQNISESTLSVNSFTKAEEIEKSKEYGQEMIIEGAHHSDKEEALEISKDEFLDAHEQRLRRLTSLHLAEQVDTGVWKVAENFIGQLEKWNQEKPLHQLSVHARTKLKLEEQVPYRGITWLDRFTGEKIGGEFAYHGFGADLRNAVLDRMQAVHDMGIDPRSPQRFRQLAELERVEFGQMLERQGVGQFHDLEEGQALKGKVSGTFETASGRRFVQIMDELESRQMLVPYKKTLEKMRGQAVAVNVSKGKLHIKNMERKLER